MNTNPASRNSNQDQQANFSLHLNNAPTFIRNGQENDAVMDDKESPLDEDFDPKKIRPIGKYEDMGIVSDEEDDISEHNSPDNDDSGVDDEDSSNSTIK